MTSLSALSDEEFADLFTQKGAAELSRYLQSDVRQVYKKRRDVERRLNTQLLPPS